MIDDSTRPSHPLGRAAWCALIIVVLAGAAARTTLIASALARSGSTLDDPDNYLPLARSIQSGEGLAIDGRPTAYRPPLYPIVLVPLLGSGRGALGVAALHVALGIATIIATAGAAFLWKLTPPRLIVAAALVALDPVLVAQSRAVMTETLAAFLTAASLAALAGPWLNGSLAGGLTLGLSTLCRPSAWPGAVLTLIARSLHDASKPAETARFRFVPSLVLLVTMLIVVAPWCMRNALVLGEPILTTTHGGYTLALANNPTYYDEVVNGPPGAVWTGDNQWLWWDSVNRAHRGLSEPEADRRIRGETIGFIRSRPVDFLRASRHRFLHFWAIAPAASVYSRPLRTATMLWTIPFWIALALGLTQSPCWRWPRVSATMQILGLTCVHLIYWTDLRMRAAIVPALALVAATASFPRLEPRFTGWRRQRSRPENRRKKTRKF